ncbi:MAG TPA: hypothetical protein VIG62_18445 [Blastocatellia bacterium]
MLKLKAFSIALALAFALVLACLMPLIKSVSAQNEGNGNGETGVFRSENLEMTVKAGFGKLVVSSWNGTWAPFRITLVNQGPPITGKLVVRTESTPNPSSQVREYVKEVQLATGSRQLHEVPAFVNSGESPSVRLEAGGETIAQASVQVDRAQGGSDQLEILVVDTEATTLNSITSAEINLSVPRRPFIAPNAPRPAAPQQAAPSNQQAGQQGAQAANANVASQPATPSAPQRQRRGSTGSFQRILHARPVVIAPEEMPRDFISYDPVDAIVIGEAPLSQISEDQSRALRHWVASGGTLIVTGGADMPGMRMTGLGEILPIEASTAGSVSSGELAELTDIYGPFDTNDAVLYLSAQAKPDARVLVGTTSKPVVAERNYGGGLVRFVAINPKLNPYRAWTSAKELWLDLVYPAAETKPRNTNWVTFGRRGPSTSGNWGVQGLLFRLADIKPPSESYFLLFLLGYLLCVGPINYFLLKWKKKTDLAWMTIPAVVILFTLVSVTVAQLSRGTTTVITDASLVELHQRDRIGRVKSGLLIMPAHKGTQEVAFDGPETFVNDAYDSNNTSSSSATGVLVSERGPQSLKMKLPMTTYSSGLFQMRSLKDSAEPMMAASEAAGGAAGKAVTLKNTGSTPITKGVYLSRAGISDLFDIEAGAEVRAVLNKPQQSMTFNNWYSDQLSGQDSEESELFTELATLLDREIGGSGISSGFFDTQMMIDALARLERPVIIGFSDLTPAEITTEGSARRRSRTLYVIHL